MPETVKLRGSTKSRIDKDKSAENVPRLEITEVVLIHCNIFDIEYQQYLRVFHIFVPNKLCGQLLDI